MVGSGRGLGYGARRELLRVLDGRGDRLHPGESGIPRPEALETLVVGAPGGEVGLRDHVGRRVAHGVDAPHVVEMALVSTIAAVVDESTAS